MAWKTRLSVALCTAAWACGLADGFTPKDSSHCLVWVSEAPETPIRSEANHGRPDEVPPTLCRPAGVTDRYTDPAGGDGSEADASAGAGTCDSGGGGTECSGRRIGLASTHLGHGTVNVTSDGTPVCVPLWAGGSVARATSGEGGGGPGVAFDFSYAAVDPTCDVWWREVSADVIPPIPELVVAFGRTGGGHKLGLCRSFGDKAEVDDRRRVVGTIALEGPDFGKCFFTRADGTTTAIDGGMFHVLQARAAEPLCVDDADEQAELRANFSTLMDEYFPASDRRRIEAVTGTPFAALVVAVNELGSCMLKQVLSAARFVPHPLNTQGLHLLRCVLAERVAEARAAKRGFDKHPDYAAWKRDGVIVKNWDTMTDDDLHDLLQVVSGEETLGIPLPPYSWVPRSVTVTDERDPQNDMHVDTFAHIVKVWIFGSDVTMEQGPLQYYKGSNQNTDGKLLWMYHYSLPPAKEAMIEPSFRLLGCPVAVEGAKDYVGEVLRGRVSLLPLESANQTLVIADPSGLHNRGEGVPGNTRRSLRLAGDTDGGLKRLNPFRPF